ncbi:hypothetical protein ANCCAN_05782 [Ancylostoma caninum]|uniref:C-type lectin domain-containing protein n=1 Tax=Ancylostoma caninum TaxID=29170 RepID=A0A368GYN3_ANCCA|nr:hypothetical protein ANCCAN_05782 [Ancylostoma caninum]
MKIALLFQLLWITVIIGGTSAYNPLPTEEGFTNTSPSTSLPESTQDEEEESTSLFVSSCEFNEEEDDEQGNEDRSMSMVFSHKKRNKREDALTTHANQETTASSHISHSDEDADDEVCPAWLGRRGEMIIRSSPSPCRAEKAGETTTVKSIEVTESNKPSRDEKEETTPLTTEVTTEADLTSTKEMTTLENKEDVSTSAAINTSEKLKFPTVNITRDGGKEVHFYVSKVPVLRLPTCCFKETTPLTTEVTAEADLTSTKEMTTLENKEDVSTLAAINTPEKLKFPIVNITRDGGEEVHFYFVNESSTWMRAHVSCRTMGLNLGEFRSGQESDDALKIYRSNHCKGCKGLLWVGAQRKKGSCFELSSLDRPHDGGTFKNGIISDLRYAQEIALEQNFESWSSSRNCLAVSIEDGNFIATECARDAETNSDVLRVPKGYICTDTIEPKSFVLDAVLEAKSRPLLYIRNDGTVVHHFKGEGRYFEFTIYYLKIISNLITSWARAEILCSRAGYFLGSFEDDSEAKYIISQYRRHHQGNKMGLLWLGALKVGESIFDYEYVYDKTNVPDIPDSWLGGYADSEEEFCLTISLEHAKLVPRDCIGGFNRNFGWSWSVVGFVCTKIQR